MTTAMSDIETGISRLVPTSSVGSGKSSQIDTGTARSSAGPADTEDESKFETTFKGLDRARKIAQAQMMKIVNEVPS